MEIIITILIAVLLTLLKNYIKVSSLIVSTILDLAPVITASLMLFFRDPLNYLKIMNLKRRDIYFEFTVNLKGIDINENGINKFESKLKCLDKDNGRIDVKKGSVDSNSYKSLIRVLSIPIEINKINENMMITISNSMSFKRFSKFIKQVLDVMNNTFSKERLLGYGEVDLRLRIRYIQDVNIKNSIYNPYVDYIFKKFPNRKVNISFTCKNESRFKIKTNYIDINSNDIESLKMDLRRTLFL